LLLLWLEMLELLFCKWQAQQRGAKIKNKIQRKINKIKIKHKEELSRTERII